MTALRFGRSAVLAEAPVLKKESVVSIVNQLERIPWVGLPTYSYDLLQN